MSPVENAIVREKIENLIHSYKVKIDINSFIGTNN